MDIGNNKDVVRLLSQSILNAQKTIILSDSAASQEVESNSQTKVHLARLESVLSKINSVDLSIFKLLIHFENQENIDLNQQQSFLQTIFKILEKADNTSEQIKQLTTLLQKSGIAKDLSKMINLSESSDKFEFITKLVQQNIKAEVSAEDKSVLITKLQHIHDQKDFKQLGTALNALNGNNMLELSKAEKSLANSLLNLFKSAKDPLITKEIKPTQNMPAAVMNRELVVQDIKTIINLKTQQADPKYVTLEHKLTLEKVVENLAKNQNYKLTQNQQAALVLELIKTSFILKSSALLRASIDLLNTDHLSNKSVFEILMPLVRSESGKISDADNKGLINHKKKAYSEQHSKSENLSKFEFKDNMQSAGNADKIKANFDALISDTLNKFNKVADENRLENYHLFYLPFAAKACEIKYKKQNCIDKKNSKSKSQSKQVESIECSVSLPKLGNIGIKISILEKSVSVRLQSESDLTCQRLSNIVSGLGARLSNQGFEKPAIFVNQSPIDQIKPDWILDLIKIQKTC